MQDFRFLSMHPIYDKESPAYDLLRSTHFKMTSSNGNILCVTVPLCGEFTGKASDAELWCILSSAPEQPVE